MSDIPPPENPTRISPSQIREGGNVENMTLRLLRDMRQEHAAAMQAVTTELATMRRLYGGMEAVFDRLDEIKAELTAFRAETAKSLRRLEGDMIAAEGQNIQRQHEIIEAVARLGELEAAEAGMEVG